MYEKISYIAVKNWSNKDAMETEKTTKILTRDEITLTGNFIRCDQCLKVKGIVEMLSFR